MLTVPRAPDAHRLLLRSLFGLYPDVLLLSSGTAPWASATFVGARHRLVLRFATADDAGAARAALPGMDLPLRRHLVADLTATIDTAHPTEMLIEALTVEDH